MSEEFALYASFKTDSKETIELIEKVEKCFDDENYNYLVEVLSESNVDFSSESLISTVKSTLSPHSHYLDNYDGDFIQAFKQTAEENSPQLTIKGKKKRKLSIEGHDHGADDFCTFFMSFLFALELYKLTGEAGNPGWYAKWEIVNSKLTVEFHEPEE